MDKEKCLEKLASSKNILIIQDIDGVCVPLVKDPMQREIDSDYINSVAKLNGEFYVLTCGEHEGKRGVNRLIEKSINCDKTPGIEGLYMPGLASCGVEYQDKFGKISILGLTKEEINYLRDLPIKMKDLLVKGLIKIFPNLSNTQLKSLSEVAICDTRFTPTMNLNQILILAAGNTKLQIELQHMMLGIMNELIELTKGTDLENSFYLHIMPNIGKVQNKEIMKFATKNDIGTTDIQFIINGAIKEAGLLVLLNKFIQKKTGEAPFGEDFNVRSAPKSIKELVNLCSKRIRVDDMPLLIGVGDTVTSTWNTVTNEWSRGGSDRGFLTLIHQLGRKYNKDNKIIFVNSSNEEVKRPLINYKNMEGVSDLDDILKFDLIMTKGPKEYKEWFKRLADKR